jgi:hypothetical protein
MGALVSGMGIPVRLYFPYWSAVVVPRVTAPGCPIGAFWVMVIVAPVMGASITAPLRLVAETEAPEPPPPPLQDASVARIRKDGSIVLTALMKKAEKSLDLSMGFPLKNVFIFKGVAHLSGRFRQGISLS